MALSDPQTVTVNAVAQPMPRVEVNGSKSVYSKSDLSFILTVSHQKSTSKGNRRIRSMARLDQRAIVPDPLTAVNDYETLSVYAVIDRPEAGFSSAQVDQLVAGFKTWLDTTMVGKLYGQET